MTISVFEMIRLSDQKGQLGRFPTLQHFATSIQKKTADFMHRTVIKFSQAWQIRLHGFQDRGGKETIKMRLFCFIHACRKASNSNLVEEGATLIYHSKAKHIFNKSKFFLKNHFATFITPFSLRVSENDTIC